MSKKEINLPELKQEINKQIADKEMFETLVATAFKGLTPQVAKRAILEGVMRGFEFKDFLEKNVYAIPFKGNYSLVTSIDYARKIGMRSGIVGKSKPEFEFSEDGKVVSCTVTVKKQVNGYVGDYTATVYFDEYYKAGRTYNGKYTPTLWDSKPKTMIAKVAEMHALRSACPEELSQAYIEEDYSQDVEVVETIPEEVKKKVSEAKTKEELNKIYTEHEGLGKEFAELITSKQKELKDETA